MALKQRPISTRNELKEPHVIGQYCNGSRSSFVEIRILKIKGVEKHVQLSKMQSALVYQGGPILLYHNAQPHDVRMALQKLTDLGYETLPYPPFSFDLSATVYLFIFFFFCQASGHFYASPQNKNLFQRIFRLQNKTQHFKMGNIKLIFCSTSSNNF